MTSQFDALVSKGASASTLPLTTKSPLRYPGGKTRAVGMIRLMFPPGTKEIVSPFLGGGSVELACAAGGMRVHASDAFQPLMSFWKQAKADPEALAERVRQLHPMTKTKFYELQRSLADLNDTMEQAAVFFALNRASFSGTTMSGGMSPDHPRFNEGAIERLRNFRADGLFLQCMDYREALERHDDKFLFLDPPYANGGRLYGDRGDMHEGFNHAELADRLKRRTGWLLTYNDCEVIRELYDGYDMHTPQWTYGMSIDKTSKEIVVLSL